MMRSFSIRHGLAALLLGVFALGAGAQAPTPTPQAADAITSAEAIAMQRKLIANEPAPTIARTLAKMRAACDWQLQNLYFYIDKKTGKPNPKRNSDADWVRGAFYTGVVDAYRTTTDYRFYLAAKAISEKNNWATSERPRKKLKDRQAHADDHTIAQTYIELYMLEGKKDPKQIEAIKKVYDELAANPQPGRDEWWWCDALYMDPPAMVRLSAATGDPKYTELMDKLYWDAHEYLYDKEEKLFYRDDSYFKKREKNGRKVFWSRGDGWVFGGLCRVMDYLPKDHPSRPKYEQLFKEMAGAIVKTQGEEGLWHASLLDPASYPLGEASGSGFYTYGLAWGINNGLLDKATYLPAVEKGWKALMACVDEQTGKLQYVQFIGADPQLIKREDNMEYGTGSFLLAGGQWLKLTAPKAEGKAEVTAENPTDVARPAAMIGVSWGKLEGKLRGLLPWRVRVANAEGKEIVSQVLYDRNGPQSLIFMADFKAKEGKTFKVTLADEPAQRVPESKVYGRFVPERLDDFAWENDKIAFRVYGPGLQDQARAGKDYMISSGIDTWVKRTPNLIVNKWYALADYHNDRGEGLDNYKVDNSRGVGGIGIWDGKTLVSSENFKAWRVTANGPLLLSFELDFAPWQVNGRQFSETKIVTLAAGSNMNHIASMIKSDKREPYQVGIGLNQTRGKGKVVQDKQNGILAYWEDADPKGNGSIGTGAVVAAKQIEAFTFMDAPKATQNLVILNVDAGQPVYYYAGAGWSKSGQFADAAAWQAYLEQFVQRQREPLKMDLK